METKTEEILGFLHSSTNDYWEFFAFISDNHIENRHSEKSDIFRMPLELIPINTLFVYKCVMNPGKMETSCREAQIDKYLEVINNQHSCDYFNLHSSSIGSNPIDFMKERVKQLRDSKINAIIRTDLIKTNC